MLLPVRYYRPTKNPDPQVIPYVLYKPLSPHCYGFRPLVLSERISIYSFFLYPFLMNLLQILLVLGLN